MMMMLMLMLVVMKIMVIMKEKKQETLMGQCFFGGPRQQPDRRHPASVSQRVGDAD
jgi:hypothetical protein